MTTFIVYPFILVARCRFTEDLYSFCPVCRLHVKENEKEKEVIHGDRSKKIKERQ